MYSHKSALTERVCKELEFNFSVGFVETEQRGDEIFVRGTAGKPDEFRALRLAAVIAGYTYDSKQERRGVKAGIFTYWGPKYRQGIREHRGLW